MGLGISSLYNRFSRWAEKQPQIKADKLFQAIAHDDGYWSYIRNQEEYAWRVKSLVKDGAVFTTEMLLAAVKQESRALSMFSRDQPKVVTALLDAGVKPNAACFDVAHRNGFACFRTQLDEIESVSTAAVKYAITCHGEDAALLDKLLGQKPTLTAGVITTAVLSKTLPEAQRLDLVKRIIATGVQPDDNAIEWAVYKQKDALALALLDAGAPATVSAMSCAIENGLQDIVKKLHEKGCSFDETLATCAPALQVRVKAYRKMITGEGEADAEIAELKELVKELTARLEKVEGGATDKKAKVAPGRLSPSSDEVAPGRISRSRN